MLFGCGRNQWRSPTAETIYRNDERLIARSAGTSANSPRQVSAKDLEWADLVLAMEQKYKSRMMKKFRGSHLPPIVSLDIPDEFERMDPELMRLVQERTEPQIERWFET